MSSYPPPGSGPYSGPGSYSSPGGVGRRIEEAIELIEMEVRHAAAYVNDAIVPQVRTESISALRNVANSLRNFADRLEVNQVRDQARQQTPPPPSTPPGSRS